MANTEKQKIAWSELPKQIALWLYALQKKHWVTTFLLIKLSGFWFSLILSYFGENLKLVQRLDGHPNLTTLGSICTVCLLAVFCIFDASRSYVQHMDNGASETGAFKFLNKLRIAIGAVCSTKLNSLTDTIDKLKRGRLSAKDLVFTEPRIQLQTIGRQMENCLISLLDEGNGTDAGPQDIFVTIAYQFPEEADKSWHWATPEHGLDFERLLDTYSHKRTCTFKYLLDSGHRYVFFNSKEKAKEQGRYISDEYDEYDGDELQGSIACYMLNITKNDHVYIRSVISITSYQKPFTSDNSRGAIDNVKKNMDNFVVSEFAERIKIELCSLYLSILSKQDENT